MTEEILRRLDALGVGYCSKRSCKEDEMATGFTWADAISTDIELLLDMLAYYEDRSF